MRFKTKSNHPYKTNFDNILFLTALFVVQGDTVTFMSLIKFAIGTVEYILETRRQNYFL